MASSAVVNCSRLTSKCTPLPTRFAKNRASSTFQYRGLRCRSAYQKISKRTFYHSSTAEEVNDDSKGGRSSRASVFAPLDTFARRHIGPTTSSTEQMLKALVPPAASLDEFVTQVLPKNILSSRDLKIEGSSQAGAYDAEGLSESQLLARLREIAKHNKVLRSYIGTGYAGTITPEVIKRNILENPGWYTSYTPYQPEISQGNQIHNTSSLS
jgi:glycine dehydrogenase